MRIGSSPPWRSRPRDISESHLGQVNVSSFRNSRRTLCASSKWHDRVGSSMGRSSPTTSAMVQANARKDQPVCQAVAPNGTFLSSSSNLSRTIRISFLNSSTTCGANPAMAPSATFSARSASLRNCCCSTNVAGKSLSEPKSTRPHPHTCNQQRAMSRCAATSSSSSLS